MPNLLAQASIDAETQNELKSRFEDFLNYMQEHEKDYFLNDYQTKA